MVPDRAAVTSLSLMLAPDFPAQYQCSCLQADGTVSTPFTALPSHASQIKAREVGEDTEAGAFHCGLVHTMNPLPCGTEWVYTALRGVASALCNGRNLPVPPW